MRIIGQAVYLLHPALHGITKLWPNEPPQKGDTVLVEGFVGLGRCRVVVDPRLEWRGQTWRLRGPIKVVPDPV